MKNWPICSTRRRKRIFWVALGALTLAAGLAGLLFGAAALSPGAVLSALFGRETGTTAARIVLYARLPRTAAALLAGAALAVSGAVIQTVLRNPLASPGLVGVNAGAGLAVAVLCAAAPLAQRFLPLAAFVGALAAALLILGLARQTGASRITVVLAGVAISSLFNAGIDTVVTLVPEALAGVADFRVGGFSGVTMARLAPAAAVIGVSLAAVFTLTRQLDVLALGGDTAQSLGLAVRPTRLLLLTLAAALAGAVVSFGGLLSFVGLVVPHTMRRFVGEESLPLLAASALGGGFFVAVCDLLARLLFAPYELPVGVVLAFVGAPFFLWLLRRQRGGRR